MLMILMKFSFVPETFLRFFFQDEDHDQVQDSTIKFNNKSYALNIEGTHQIWWCPRKFFSKSKSCENQNSVQNQDQDQDHDITLDFNTRTTFYT